MSTTIALRDLDAAIRKAISERGRDHVYQQVIGSCFYRSVILTDTEGRATGSEGPAGCLVGCAFDDLGVLPERLGFSGMWSPSEGAVDGASASQLAESLEVFFEHNGEDVTDAVGAALNSLQGKQDGEYTWGYSYTNGWLYELVHQGLGSAVAEFRKAWDEQ